MVSPPPPALGVVGLPLAAISHARTSVSRKAMRAKPTARGTCAGGRVPEEEEALEDWLMLRLNNPSENSFGENVWRLESREGLLVMG